MKKKAAKPQRKSKAPAKAKNPQTVKEQETAEQTKFNPTLQKQFAKKSGHPYPGK